jgi:hypothetical protein
MVMKGRTPATALLLGFAGLIPFVWAAMLVLGLAPSDTILPTVLQGDGRLIMIRYGGIILPFMAGVLWGFATNARGTQAIAAYTLSVLPALWWFFMPGAGVSSALINLATGFVGVLIIDYAFSKWDLTPSWWMSLRVQLTTVVIACLCIGVFA